jgi:hypothetical protein
MTRNLWSKRWIEGRGRSETRSSGPATIESMWFHLPSEGIHYARSCVLTVPGKFFAETMLVYPCNGVNFPVFGSEYIEMRGRYFGAVDFHPVSGETDYIDAYFSDFPDRMVQKSAHYDLDTYFSRKLWHKRADEPFYEEFVEVCEARLGRFTGVLPSLEPFGPDYTTFDAYMAENDPAHGILRAYFGPEFADDYVKGFLFPGDSGDFFGTV